MGFFSSVGNIFSSGGGGDLIGGVVSGVDMLTGGWASDQMSKSSAKRQYKYNERLQDANMDFQKYMAENAHQMEMADLEAAGINPALTATGSSAGSIAGKSASQGTSGGQIADLSGIVDSINSTRLTNADVEQKDTQTKYIRQQIENETTSAKANLINAEANAKNADTEEKLAEGGWGAKILGTANEYAQKLPGIIGTIASIAGGGGTVLGAIKAGRKLGGATNIVRKAHKATRKLRVKSSAR